MEHGEQECSDPLLKKVKKAHEITATYQRYLSEKKRIESMILYLLKEGQTLSSKDLIKAVRTLNSLVVKLQKSLEHATSAQRFDEAQGKALMYYE